MEAVIFPGQSKEDFWRGHLDGWRASGLTKQEYCRQHGLSKSAMGWWRTKLARKTAGEVSLVPVPFRLQGSHDNRAGLTLVVGSRYRVEVGDDFHGATLTRLLKVLG